MGTSNPPQSPFTQGGRKKRTSVAEGGEERRKLPSLKRLYSPLFGKEGFGEISIAPFLSLPKNEMRYIAKSRDV
jgi:hypothetical protein